MLGRTTRRLVATSTSGLFRRKSTAKPILAATAPAVKWTAALHTSNHQTFHSFTMIDEETKHKNNISKSNELNSIRQFLLTVLTEVRLDDGHSKLSNKTKKALDELIIESLGKIPFHNHSSRLEIHSKAKALFENDLFKWCLKHIKKHPSDFVTTDHFKTLFDLHTSKHKHFSILEYQKTGYPYKIDPALLCFLYQSSDLARDSEMSEEFQKLSAHLPKYIIDSTIEAYTKSHKMLDKAKEMKDEELKTLAESSHQVTPR